MRPSVVATVVLSLAGCAAGPTALDVELLLDPQIRFVEISSRQSDGRPVFPLSSIQVTDGVTDGSVVILLPDTAPLMFELGVRGLTADRSAVATFATTVTLERHEIHRVRVVLGPPQQCAAGPCVRCGDERIDDGETCDDGNEASSDGCSPTCTVEPLFECVGVPSTCAPIAGPASCGDGRITGDEVCDDGNLKKDDGCSDECRVDRDWECFGEPSVCNPDCSLPCTDSCPRSGCCTSVCGARDCQILCPDGCQCTIDCSGSETCDVECKKDSVCTIDCNGANNCDKIHCRRDAQCVTLCGSANNCAWDRCDGPDMVCGADVLTCNAPCP